MYINKILAATDIEVILHRADLSKCYGVSQLDISFWDTYWHTLRMWHFQGLLFAALRRSTTCLLPQIFPYFYEYAGKCSSKQRTQNWWDPAPVSQDVQSNSRKIGVETRRPEIKQWDA